MNQDRRQYPRLIPDAALLVSLGQSRRGFLSDLSEGGMAFDGLAAAASGPNIISLAFDLPEGGGTIQAVGEIVWTSDSRHRTGVRFLELAAASQQKLRDWLSKRVVTIEGGEQEGSSQCSAVGALSGAAQKWILQEIGASEETGAASSEKPGKKWNWRWIADVTRHYRSMSAAAGAVAVVVMCSAFVTIGYYLPGMILAPASAQPTVPMSTKTLPPMDSTASVKAVSETPVSEIERDKTSQTPARAEGVVLQVGAMAHKENADALVSRLQKRNFPAFISEGGKDGLYRVDVGPYADQSYAHSVKDELSGAGFGTALERKLRP